MIILCLRHEVAEHNEADERSRKVAKKDPDSQERARLSVLENPKFVDSPLSRTGRQRCQDLALKLKEKLKSLDDYTLPDIMYTSPLRRCDETARTVYERAKIVPDPMLRERRTGRPCDMTMGEFLMSKTSRSTKDSIENNMALRSRVEDFIRKLRVRMRSVKKKDRTPSVGIVSHKAWLREMDNYFRSEWSTSSQLSNQKIFRNGEIRKYSLNFTTKYVSMMPIL